jgi:uncharacterized repeat protein (TIGR01451 family)
VSGTGTWTVGTIASGTSETLTITATVVDGTGNATIANTAQVTASDVSDPDSTPNNNNASEDDQASINLVTQTADLSLTKSVSNATPNVGGTVTYTVTVLNNGPAGATNVAVKDLLPAGVTFASATSTQGTYVSGTGIWSVGSLANAASKTLTVTATVDAGTGATTITNSAQVTASQQSDPDSTPNNSNASEDDQASAALTVTSADLSLTKTIDDATPNVGQNVTYTITVTNSGPSTATGVAVEDLLPAGITFVSATSTQGTYLSGTGIWSVGTVLSGTSKSLTIVATVANGAGSENVTNPAQVSSSDQSDPDSTPGNDDESEDDMASANLNTQIADLSLTKSIDNDFPKETDTIVYTLTVTDSGPDAASGVKVKDLLPAGLTFVSASSTQGTYVSSTGIWTVGAIVNGATKNLTITATIDTGTNGSDLINIAQVFAVDQADPDSSPNNSNASEDDQVSVTKPIGIHTNTHTTENRTQLSRSKAGETATMDFSFELTHVLNSTTVITFPEGFVPTAAPTAGTCTTGTIDTFSFDAQARTFSGVKHGCSGTVTLTGGTVTNPTTPGSYTIRWVNDDPGETTIYITSEDQIHVHAVVGGALSFNVGVQDTNAEACDETFSGNGGTVDLGTLTPDTIASSDVGGVNHICTRLSTNAKNGTVVTVSSANAALKSISNPTDLIPSLTAAMVPGVANYGLCASDTVNGSASTTPTGTAPTANAPFTASCPADTADGSVGALTTEPQTVWSVPGVVANAFYDLVIKAAISSSIPAHNDYADTLTFIATGTF